eukprot:tig00020713_g13406.t1
MVAIIGRLEVKCCRATQLKKKSTLVKMDPYVQLKFGTEILRGPTHLAGGRKPQWEADLDVPIREDTHSYILDVEVWDEKAVLADALIGSTKVDFFKLVHEGGSLEDWFDLKSLHGSAAGQVYLKIRYVPKDKRKRLPQPEKTLSTNGVASGSGSRSRATPPARNTREAGDHEDLDEELKLALEASKLTFEEEQKKREDGPEEGAAKDGAKKDEKDKGKKKATSAIDDLLSLGDETPVAPPQSNIFAAPPSAMGAPGMGMAPPPSAAAANPFDDFAATPAAPPPVAAAGNPFDNPFSSGGPPPGAPNPGLTVQTAPQTMYGAQLPPVSQLGAQPLYNPPASGLVVGAPGSAASSPSGWQQQPAYPTMYQQQQPPASATAAMYPSQQQPPASAAAGMYQQQPQQAMYASQPGAYAAQYASQPGAYAAQPMQQWGAPAPAQQPQQNLLF